MGLSRIPPTIAEGTCFQHRLRPVSECGTVKDQGSEAADDHRE